MVAVEDVQIRSYMLWEAAGRPDGQDVEFWLRAEAELEAEARCAPKPGVRLAVAVVPRVRIYSAPQRMTAMRVPSRAPKPAATPAMR